MTSDESGTRPDAAPDPEDDPSTPARTEPDPEREGDPDARAEAARPTGDDEVGA
jgi:hypothetical protein